MSFSLYINNVQHVKRLEAVFNLNDCRVTCIAGKNGCGKTTLIRAIQNIRTSDIFRRTASPYIFDESSQIKYFFYEKVYVYEYNKKLKHIDTRHIVPKKLKDLIYVEMPIPHGMRFSRFSNLANIDEELRKKIALKEYESPIFLQRFLYNVYRNSKFDGLREVWVRGERYYFLLKENGLYIREDYFSSGEYFLINLYRLINQNKKLIAIDELDISLDAEAQVRLVGELRRFCQEYRLNIVFTTHSLPLMKTLNRSELYYMECNDGESVIRERPYNFIKSVLFGFVGWDKYLLVEDKMTERYIEFLLEKSGGRHFFKHKIIFVGGASQVVSLMGRNAVEGFLSEERNVIAVLDGDMSEKESFRERANTFFLPFSNVENEALDRYESGGMVLPEPVVVAGKNKNRGKNFYKQLLKRKLMTEAEVFEVVTNHHQEQIEGLLRNLSNFLSE